MKNLILIIGLFFYSATYSQEYKLETITGGYIYHTVMLKPLHNYESAFNRGLFRPTTGIKLYKESKKHYSSIAAFYTKNCIKKDQFGATYSFGRKYTHKTLDILLGGTIGFYTENKDDWDKLGYNDMPMIVGGLMPVMGGEIIVRKNFKHFYVSVNQVVSVIMHTSVSIGVKL